MPHPNPSRVARWLLVAGGCLLALPLAAKSAPKITGPLTVHMRNDRLTLRMAKAPQVYLAGIIDAAAVEQVRQLQQSGKLMPGSDIYLDSSTGDAASGIALGKLFRTARYNTHVGAWRTGTAPAPPAACVDACAYAFLGGVYRWTPTGADRIGLHQGLLPDNTAVESGEPSPADLQAYMQSMGVDPKRFAKVSGLVVNGMAWWDADKMAPWQVSNNGRLPVVASYQPSAGSPPTLQLSQEVRGDRNIVTLQCAPGGQFTLDARYTVGTDHAALLAARAMYAYFEVDGQPWQLRLGKRPQADGDALVFQREMPFAQLAPVLHTGSLAAWIEIVGSPVRLGFWIAPSDVQQDTQAFYADCQKIQPGYVPPAPPPAPVKPSFWKRIFGHK